MSKISLQDIRSLPDVVIASNWDLFFPHIPTGDSSKPLTIKALQTEVPGIQIPQVAVTAHGVTVGYGGIPQWSHMLPVVFWETRDMTTRNTLLNWINYRTNVPANTGTYKASYASRAQLVLYDDAENIIRTIDIHGVFPLSVSPIQVAGSDFDRAMMLQAEFWYDYTTEVNGGG